MWVPWQCCNNLEDVILKYCLFCHSHICGMFEILDSTRKHLESSGKKDAEYIANICSTTFSNE